jgi:hypothetical protein
VPEGPSPQTTTAICGSQGSYTLQARQVAVAIFSLLFKDEAAPAKALAAGCYFFSSFLIFLSAFFSFGVLAGSFLDAFLLSWPLLMIALLFVEIQWSE